MAVEAHHLHLFSPQSTNIRESFHSIEDKANFYNTQMGFRIDDDLFPFYTCPIADSLLGFTTTNNAADSDLTCNFSTTPHKRMREFNGNSHIKKEQSSILSSDPLFSFLGEDTSLQIQHQHSETDRFISQHMEKMRMDIAESRQRNAKRIYAAVEQGMTKRLKAKEDEIQKMGRLNWALEERVKSLCIENQIWRDLARTNEATANALRTNLEQVLARVSNEQPRCELAEDAESCCDRSDEDGRRKEVKDKKRSCRNCEKEEPCVLLLPCRHLCLCNKCGSRLNTCPVCKVNKSGSVHVNIS
ncbi:putative BOI-related E3 ubiquitin-protein ligase 2 [Cinnamomum micranthum f. kanehirae]|uniref:Putative BOI-related E3 ubiquitin-protein ligase 2 n=1 Tax=Cinnamomum micranthum f. kanehirae TaxID=337451 RepID=A0A3S3MT30_9MAGN|nr:putative BOI-related E3 ubiquitin-protein ligase 2 [Cinnamomum micranthum f. kanehirae]